MLQLYSNIKNRRKELGMTQSELADKLGYADKSMIAKIESGKIDLSQSKILAFAEALNTHPSDLMGWDGDEAAISDGYYINPEVAEIAQQIYDNPGKRALFDATRDVSKEDIEKVLQIINVITKDD